MNLIKLKVIPGSVAGAGRVNRWALALLGVGLTLSCGCATPSIEARRADRAEAYAAFSPEARALVDAGQITQGMDTNAVFIAWGRPTNVTVGGGDEVNRIDWYYYRNSLRASPAYYWRQDGYGFVAEEVPGHTTVIRYLARKVVFHDGRVTRFQTYSSLRP
jgi:hypothetical protein